MHRPCVAALILLLSLLVQGCCPGPHALAAGTWARSRTGLGAGVLAVLDVDRNLIAFPPAEDQGARSADGSHSLVTMRLWLEGDPLPFERGKLRLSPLFIRQQHGQVVARHPLSEEVFHKDGVLELAIPLKTEEGKPLPMGKYALQVYLQGPDDPYPTLAQVDLVVRSCVYY
jgi:hypothetical protein